jgi:curved DNA-binding protein CbpA
MTRQEALEVVGLAADASRSDVEREYRRLMKKLHPDVGGSGYLAGKLNQAREVLLS